MLPNYRAVPRPSDIEAVRHMVADTGFFRPDEVEVAVELVEERLAKGIDSGYHFIFADIGDTPAGYVCFGPTPCTIGSFDLYWIVVDAKRQGQGLGLALCQMVEQSARQLGCRRLYVETSGKEQYAPTRKFYRKAGFSEVAALPDFYDFGDAKIILQKTFEEKQ